MTKLQEAYQTMQDACDIRKGDQVRCLRSFKNYELGCIVTIQDSSHSQPKKRFIADKATGIVIAVQRSHIIVECGTAYGGVWKFPFFILEVVEKVKTIRKEVKYYDESGSDITDSISQETQKNLNHGLME